MACAGCGLTLDTEWKDSVTLEGDGLRCHGCGFINLVKWPARLVRQLNDTTYNMARRFKVDTTGWLLTSELCFHEVVERNERKQLAPNQQRCLICSNPLKGDHYMVQFTTSGYYIPLSAVDKILTEGETDEHGCRGDHESQGWWPVGPECAKKLKGYAIKHADLWRLQFTFLKAVQEAKKTAKAVTLPVYIVTTRKAPEIFMTKAGEPQFWIEDPKNEFVHGFYAPDGTWTGITDKGREWAKEIEAEADLYLALSRQDDEDYAKLYEDEN